MVVGIADGFTAYDNSDHAKKRREEHFPVALLEAGVGFKCREGEASQPEDKEKILSSIGDKHEELDNLVHGVMAQAGLIKALAAGGERFDRFVQGLAEGKLRKLWVDCQDVPAEQHTEENMRRIVQAVDPETIEELTIFRSKAGGSWLAPLVGREFTRLKKLNLWYCKQLDSLPEGVFDGMGELEKLYLNGCKGLSSLPEGVFDKVPLKVLNLRNCPAAKSLPQSTREKLEAKGCHIVVEPY